VKNPDRPKWKRQRGSFRGWDRNEMEERGRRKEEWEWTEKAGDIKDERAV